MDNPLAQSHDRSSPLLLANTGQLVITKLSRPTPPSDIVIRARLHEKLNHCWQYGVVLVAAPAGFGKTTLICEWAGQQENPIAWLTLDKADNSFAGFLQYLCAALGTIHPGLGDTALAILYANPSVSLLQAMASLVTELGNRAGELTLILDDYHLVEEEAIHQAISFFVDHLPENIHLILGSRTLPPLPLARWQAEKQAFVLGTEDLRFTTGEIQQFIVNAQGLRLTGAVATLLEARSEGWIAGLRLVSLRSRQKDHPEKFMTSWSGEEQHLFDYFMEEAFSQLPASTQDFLLQTSILNRFTASLCEKVTGQTQGEAIIHSLLRKNMFIMVLDENHHWFRYHHLFAAALQRQLLKLQSLLSFSFANLHVRAGEWHEEHQFFSEALNHYIAAQEFGKAAWLIERKGLALLLHSNLSTMSHWLGLLPHEVMGKRPWLMVYKAWVRLLSRTLPLESELEDADQLAAACEDGQIIRGHIAVIRGFVALQRGAPDLGVKYAQKAFELLPEEPKTVQDTAYLILGNACLLSYDILKAVPYYQKGYNLAFQTGNMTAAHRIAGNLADLQVTMGQLDQAMETSSRALREVRLASGNEHPIAGRVHICLGAIAYERNRLDEAERHIAKGMDLGIQAANRDVLAHGSILMARLRLAQGDLKGARLIFGRIDTSGASYGAILWDAGLLEELRLDLLRLSNDLVRAQSLVLEKGLGLEDRPSLFHEPEYLAWARLLVATGQSREAIRLLEDLSRRAGKNRLLGRQIKFFSLKALALKKEKRYEEALRALKKALQLAEPQGYVRSFLDEGKAMDRLLDMAYESGVTSEFMLRIRPCGGGDAVGTPVEKECESLSQREMQVLHRLADGASNMEIAHSLDVVTGTIKAHVSKIFKKLEVTSRSQAVAKARSLGLLK